jgi:hypothetical protein
MGEDMTYSKDSSLRLLQNLVVARDGLPHACRKNIPTKELLLVILTASENEQTKPLADTAYQGRCFSKTAPTPCIDSKE